MSKRSEALLPDWLTRGELLSARDAARVLGISERKLWELANRGEIARVELDPRCKRYDPRDLHRWIEARKRGGP